MLRIVHSKYALILGCSMIANCVSVNTYPALNPEKEHDIQKQYKFAQQFRLRSDAFVAQVVNHANAAWLSRLGGFHAQGLLEINKLSLHTTYMHPTAYETHKVSGWIYAY